ncbi:hypothetical protein [Microcella sp.]|uniref:hypothetical protein n=1 Tax=Microcella sp. TaxID=1913979 RepID=UPI00391AC870
MSSLRHPVGPQPPSVYWRRRAVVGLGLIAVIVVIILIVVRPGTAEPTGSTEPTPAATDSAEGADGDDEQSDLDAAAEEAAAEGGGAPQACTSEQVQVTPLTDAESYGPESQPQLSLSLLNTGTRPCIIEAGSDVQEFLITSGPDRIWSSRDCQVDPVAATVVLEPGEERSTPAIPWNRTRSEPGVCDVQRTPVPGGGATYRLSVSVGEFAGDGDRPFLLN